MQNQRKAIKQDKIMMCMCLTFCDPMDCSPSGSSLHGIFKARILEWIAISFSRGSSQPRDQTCASCISCIGRWILYLCGTWDTQKGQRLSVHSQGLQIIFWAMFLSYFADTETPIQEEGVNCMLTPNIDPQISWNQKVDHVDSWLFHHQSLRRMPVNWSCTLKPSPSSCP